MINSKTLLAGTLLIAACGKDKKERPNILWIILDDTGCDFSCYGNTIIKTPVVDSLAAHGILFTQMHVTAPVSSPSRSAMITGMYQTTTGTHQHRSSRGRIKIFLDEDKETIPQLFKNEGYFTANVGYDYEAKTDYNFVWNPSMMYDTLFRIDENRWVSPWSFRKMNQPFFIQIQLAGGKNRRVSTRYPVCPAVCRPAPYYPDDSLFYYDEASYHSSTLHADKLIGDIMRHLHEEGLDKNTVVMILGDNGQDNYRDKQWLYDGGTRVPFIVYGPEKYLGKTGVVRDDLAVHIDMGVTSMRIADIPVPSYMQGVDLLVSDYREREFIVTARDRCDWTKDRIRAVRSRDFKYIRNFHPEYSYMQSNYRDQWPMVIKAKKLFAEGKLNPVQASFFQSSRPAEEFYVLKDDPFETINQIDNPAYREQIERMRKYLDEWIKKTGDRGEFEESEESYREACLNVTTHDNKDFPLISGVSFLQVKGDSAYTTLTLINTTNKTLASTVFLKGSLKSAVEEYSLKLGRGEEKQMQFVFPCKECTAPDSLCIQVCMPYSFSKKSQYTFKEKFVLHPQWPRIMPRAIITVDGKMHDWIKYPVYVFGKNKQVEFGVTWSDAFVYIGAQVFDSHITVDPALNPWEQDGIEIRLDARRDPWRSCCKNCQDFTDHLLIAMSPSESGRPVSWYLPEEAFKIWPEKFYKNEMKCVCKKNERGYVAEVAVPVSYMEQVQGKNWNAIRLNIIVHNANGIEEKRVSWQPEWHKTGNCIGSGTFIRELK